MNLPLRVLFITFLLAFMQQALVNCSICPSGSYLTGDHHCALCSPGSYCVNDQASQCYPGTYNNQYGQSTCKSCPRNSITNMKHTECIPCNYRTNEDLTFCLLPNTPMNAKEIIEGETTLTNLTEGESNFFFQEVYISSLPNFVAQLTFTTPSNKRLLIFASQLTGMPGKDNYQSVASGVNTTLALTGKTESDAMFYFNVIVMDTIPKSSNALFTNDFGRVIQPTRPQLKMGQNAVVLPEYSETIVEYKNTIANNNLRFLIDASDDQIEVYYATNPDVQFPNPNNSYFVSTNSNRVSFQARNIPIGIVRVALNKKDGNGRAIVTISQFN